MKIELIDIPNLEMGHPTRWKIKALVMDGTCPVLDDLLEWKRNSVADFKKIIKVMKIVSQLDRVRDEKHVKKSANPAHRDVYEMRAHHDSARVMFFYSEQEQCVVVCTNTYWKNKDSHREQDRAFALCDYVKRLYEQG